MYFRSSFTSKYVVCSHKNRLIEVILIRKHKIPDSIYDKKKITLNYPKSSPMGFFIRDSRTSLKQTW